MTKNHTCLYLIPSFSLSPTAPVFCARSLPAKSTSDILDTFSPVTCNEKVENIIKEFVGCTHHCVSYSNFFGVDVRINVKASFPKIRFQKRILSVFASIIIFIQSRSKCNSMPLVRLRLTICVVKSSYFLVQHRINIITLLFCFGGSRQSLKVREVKCIPGDPATTCPVLFKGSCSLLLLA